MWIPGWMPRQAIAQVDWQITREQPSDRCVEGGVGAHDPPLQVVDRDAFCRRLEERLQRADDLPLRRVEEARQVAFVGRRALHLGLVARSDWRGGGDLPCCGDLLGSSGWLGRLAHDWPPCDDAPSLWRWGCVRRT